MGAVDLTAASVWWFLSDLHLGADEMHPPWAEAAVPLFLREVVLAEGSSERHLVLLGDFAELDGGEVATPRRGSALRQLEDVLKRFPGVFAALSRCLAAGAHLHVVSGNHDVSLGYLHIQARLAKQLTGPLLTPPGPTAAADGRGELSFHQWVLHVPGLFYAEHGHQHHDFNRFPLVLAPGSGGRQAPPVTPIAAWGDRAVGHRRRVMGVVRALAGTLAAERRATQASYRAMVRREAVDAGLPAEVAERVYEVSRLRVVRAALGVVTRVLARRLGLGSRDSYLRQAAEQVDAILAVVAEPPSCYIFGHTHQPVLRTMSRGGVSYANCGTWLPGRSPAPGTERSVPYVILRTDGHRAEARLERWQWGSGLPSRSVPGNRRGHPRGA